MGLLVGGASILKAGSTNEMFFCFVFNYGPRFGILNLCKSEFKKSICGE